MPMKAAANFLAVSLDDGCGSYLYGSVIAHHFNLVF
jgi:hypothetical protein